VNKKGDFGWEEIAKIVLVLVFLIALVLIIFIYRDKAIQIIDTIRDFIRFGR